MLRTAWQALGAYVRARRQEQQLTQRELAEKAGVWMNKLSMLERGHPVAEATARKILAALGEDPESPELWRRVFDTLAATPGYSNHRPPLAPLFPLAA